MVMMFKHTTQDMLQKATSIKHAKGLIMAKQRCWLRLAAGSWPLAKITK